MMERHDYTNPWADKLQEVQLPDTNDSWNAMTVLLDKEMPLPGRSNRRRWLLLILLLLLLIGVCNCPRVSRWHPEGASKTSSDSQTPTGDLSRMGDTVVQTRTTPDSTVPGTPLAPATATNVPADKPPASGNQSAKTPVSHPATYLSGPNASVSPDPGAKGGFHSGTASPNTAGRGALRPATTASGGMPPNSALSKTTGAHIPRSGISKVRTPGFKAARPNATGTGTSSSSGTRKTGGRISGSNADGTATSGTTTFESGTSGNEAPSGRTSSVVAGKNGAGNKPGPAVTPGSAALVRSGKNGKDSAAGNTKKIGENKHPVKKPAAISDNKKTPPTDTTEEDPVRGLVAGIGFNQFFTVGQQQKSAYNSGGTSGGLGDYLPVPMVRYYFSKKLYVQLEAQFNTPQYTKNNLVASQSPGDTLSPGRIQQSSVTIKKLFYFNLPLSVHYSPIPNLYLGAGLQYSRLSNGVGLFQDKVLTAGGNDSVKATKIQSFKGDSTYRKIRTNELRFLLDINYTYKRFIAGARYNQALSRFLDVHISSTQVTQARNSSLQLYLRYILWDNRKKKPARSK